MEKVIVLAATINQLPIIQLLVDKGFYVISVDNIPENIGHKFSSRFECIDITKKEQILRLAKKENIKAIIAAYTDVGVPTAAYVSEHLGLVGPSINASNVLTNKAEFRQFYTTFKNLNLEHFQLNNIDDWKGLHLNFDKKWIVKPVDSSGSKGIEILVEESANRVVKNAFEYSISGVVQIEEYVDGKQGTLEGFLENGEFILEFITTRLTAPEPYVATQGHVFPSLFTKEEQAEIRKEVLSICQELRMTDGPLDVDFVFGKQGVFVIEMSPRLGGNNLSSFLEVVTHINLRELTINYQLGLSQNSVNLKMVQSGCFVQWVIGAEKTGVLNYNAKKMGNAKNLNFVTDLELFVEPNQKVTKFTNGRHAIGFVIFKLEGYSHLQNALDQLYKTLEFKIIDNSNSTIL